MVAPIYALWGALLGWILMPRIRMSRSTRAFRPVAAYVIAVIIAVCVMYLFDYHRQSWHFVLGLVVQFAVFLSVAWVKRLVAKPGGK